MNQFLEQREKIINKLRELDMLELELDEEIEALDAADEPYDDAEVFALYLTFFAKRHALKMSLDKFDKDHQNELQNILFLNINYRNVN